MVERSNGGEIQWPGEIEPDVLQSLLDENLLRRVNLRNVVAGQLSRESDSLSSALGSRSHPSVEGFTILATDLNNSLEFVDNDKDIEVEEITNRLSAEISDFGTPDRLWLLAEAANQYQRHIPGGIEMEAPELFSRLAKTMQYAERLRRDPTGFVLVDYLAKPEQSAYSPDHSNFEPENLGRTEAARRYKELHNLLLKGGATSDIQ